MVPCTLTGLVIGVGGVLGPVAGDVSSALTGARLAIAWPSTRSTYGELVVTSGLAVVRPDNHNRLGVLRREND